MAGERPLVRVFLGSVFIQMVLGSFFSWGSFTVHITSYLRARAPEGVSISYEQTAWVSACAGLGGFVAYFGGALHSRIGVRFTAMGGMLVLSLGVILSSHTIKLGVGPFLWTYGVMFGSGMGIAYTAPTKCVIDWVPERKGLATSLSCATVGIGTVIFNALELWLVNPENFEPTGSPGTRDLYFVEPAVLDRVPGALLYLGIVYAAASVVGALLLVERPAMDALAIPLVKASDGEADPVRSADIGPREMMRTRSFWSIWFCYFFSMQAAAFAMAFVKVFGQTVLEGSSDMSLTVVAGGSAIANAVGRVLFGYLLDVCPHRLVIACMTFFMALFTGTLELCAYGGLWMYFAWTFVVFLCVGGICSIWSAVTVEFFGAKHYGRNFGLMMTAPSLAYPASALAIYFLRGRIGDVGDSFFAAAMSALALFSGLMAKPGHKAAA